jgi:hypothetical protein
MNSTHSGVSSPSGQSTPVSPPNINGNDSRTGSTILPVRSVSGSPLLERRQNTGSSNIDTELSPKSLPTTGGSMGDPLDRHSRKRDTEGENGHLYENMGVNEDVRSNSVIRIPETELGLK